MEPREQRRGRPHRTKRARRAENRDLIPILKSPNSATRYWKLVPRLIVNDGSTREYHVLKAVCEIRSKLVDHPRVSKLDSAGKVYWIKSPRLQFVPLLRRVKDWALDLDSLLKMQQDLLHYINLLYSKGVAYQVKSEYMCPVKMESGHWKLYLGGWMETEFDPYENQLRPAEWKKQEATQCDQIERIFAVARAEIIRRYR
ncbi:hypothetical protein N7526_011468 [Penicillium atrosanguineum]|nr:hypothetical protein N7526_011468 [Penicillium atrosanguineum]